MNLRTATCLLAAVVLLAGCSSDPTDPTDGTADGREADVGDDTPDGDYDAADSAPDSALDQSDADIVREPDAGPVNPFEIIPHTANDPDQDPASAIDVTTPPAAGEVRAGRVGSWTTGFAGIQSDCRLGDFALQNAVAQFCIASPVAVTQWTYTGGQLIDADLVGEANDRLNFLSAQNQFQLAGAEAVEVLRDGSTGEAIIRVTGPEQPVALLASVVGELFQPFGVSFESEYRLLPDVPYLEMTTWVRALDRPVGMSLGDLIHFGDSMIRFTPQYGRATAPLATTFPWVAVSGEGRSYAVYAPEGIQNSDIDLSQLDSGLPFSIQVQGRGLVPTGQEAVIRRYFAVGTGGTEMMPAVIAQLEGTTPPELTRFEVTTGETPVAGALLFVGDGEGAPIHLVRSDDAGLGALALPPGQYAVWSEDWVGGDIEPLGFTVEAGVDRVVDVALPEVGRLEVSVTASGDAGPVPSPAKVVLSGAHAETLFTHDGQVALAAPPGSYEVVISRGEAYSLVRLSDVAVEVGATTEVEAHLDRVWDTTGLMSGEFHQHSSRSFDSQVSLRDRLLSNLVEGVDFVVMTDHEAVTDLSPLIDELDVAELIYAMPATEVSPSFTHFAPMPMRFDPALPGGGGFPHTLLDEDGRIFQKAFPEMVAELREDYDVSVIQVNHPRAVAGALFSYGGYDPLVGIDATNSRRFTPDFDTVEVFNEAREGEFCEVFTDWLSLIARGQRVTGVGNSDTHGFWAEAGYPRNYLPHPGESASDITDDAIIDPLLEGNVTVSGVALITLPEGPAFGSTVTVAEGGLALPVLVQTPQWATVEHLQFLVNGRVVRDVQIDAEASEVVVFDEVVHLDAPASDAYLVVVAYGEQTMPAVTRGVVPFGFTNPVYLDADGVEGWSAPGVSGEDDLARLDIAWCDE